MNSPEQMPQIPQAEKKEPKPLTAEDLYIIDPESPTPEEGSAEWYVQQWMAQLGTDSITKGAFEYNLSEWQTLLEAEQMLKEFEPTGQFEEDVLGYLEIAAHHGANGASSAIEQLKSDSTSAQRLLEIYRKANKELVANGLDMDRAYPWQVYKLQILIPLEDQLIEKIAKSADEQQAV